MPGVSSPLGSGGGRPAAAGGAPRRGISVALATHDGARFLPAQLESLVRQSRAPDELVVCDDRSSDGTVAILEDFARNAPFPVRIERNPTQLRSTRNFEKAIGLCTRDLIATCDQDDVWLPEKLALSEAAFSADARLGLVFTDAEIVDADLRPMGYRLWETIHLGKHEQHRIRSGRGFDLLLRQWLVTGATMVFRAEHRSLVLPIPECWIHDGWIAFLLGAVAPIGIVDRPTVLYRQHPGQQIGARRLTGRELYEVARSMDPPTSARTTSASGSRGSGCARSRIAWLTRTTSRSSTGSWRTKPAAWPSRRAHPVRGESSSPSTSSSAEATHAILRPFPMP